MSLRQRRLLALIFAAGHSFSVTDHSMALEVLARLVPMTAKHHFVSFCRPFGSH